MACVNAKAIRNAIKTFFKENARDPDFKEFAKLVTGKMGKEEKKADEEQEKSA